MLDVLPRTVAIEVIDQVLITSVRTRPLTLQEIKDKGIVLDSDDYLAFEFTIGLKLESKAVNLSFPVVFDSQGVRVPEPHHRRAAGAVVRRARHSRVPRDRAR